MQTLTHLYLSGGGLAGISYVGVYEALLQEHLLDSIMHFGGVSIGALFATLFAMRVDLTEMKSFVKRFFSSEDMTSVQIANPMDIWSHYGYATSADFISKPILHFLDANYGFKGSSISFIEFSKLTGKTLTVTATNLATKNVQVFSVDDTPNMCVVKAVCASACVPFLFKPVTIYGDMFIDGGVSSELPPLPFDETHENSSLAVFLIDQPRLPHDNPTSFLSFLQSIVLSLFNNSRSMRFYKNKIILDENPIEFLPLQFSKNKISINVPPHLMEDAFRYGYTIMYKYITSPADVDS
jgi:predicted acylesterase/phospholipase RssA